MSVWVVGLCSGSLKVKEGRVSALPLALPASAIAYSPAPTAVSWAKEQNIPIIVSLDVEFYGCKGEPFSKAKNCRASEHFAEQ